VPQIRSKVLNEKYRALLDTCDLKVPVVLAGTFLYYSFFQKK
jgi:hypothetical protein